MIEFLSNYWYYIIIYLSGCLVNYLLCRQPFDSFKDSDSLIAVMILLPLYMMYMTISMVFIAFSWVGTVIWCIIKLIDKYYEI